MGELVKGKVYVIYLVSCGHPGCENTWEGVPITVLQAGDEGSTKRLLKAGWYKERKAGATWMCPGPHKEQPPAPQRGQGREVSGE